MKNDDSLRKELLAYLERPHTHAPFEHIAGGLPEKLINVKPEGLPYSFWQMLEHIRISQFDMIDFMTNPKYKEMDWPKDYWPDDKQKATAKMWKDSVKKCDKDIELLKKIIKDPKTDFFAPIPHGHGQTIFREVIQIIDHASYHLGEFIVMRRLAGAWK
jgi:hypothetical protein